MMEQQQTNMIINPTTSDGGKVSEIQTLTNRISDLNQSLDFWNSSMIWALVFAAIAAVAVVLTTRTALTRAKQVAGAQEELINAKDRQLAIDFKSKDEKIADAGTAASAANERAETARLEQEKLKAQLAWRVIAAIALVVTTMAMLPWSGHAATADSMKPGRTLIGLQYETYFTPHNVGSWKTAEAEPILGYYDSYDARIMEAHEDWFEQIGIDWLLLDWSNMLGVKDPDWESHTGATHEIEETTELLLRTYHRLEAAGRRPPKLVLLLGADLATLDSGDVTRLNAVIEWISTKLLANPDYRNLWLYLQGKPLLSILLNPIAPIEHAKDFESSVSAAQWTVRWMTSQRQVNRADKVGQWSWMDGPIRQSVSYSGGLAEETVVTPASFEYSALIELFRATKDYDPAHFKGAGGWLAPTAISRDHGAPYIESWRVAFEARPKFIQIHQWNEFAGQENDQGIGSEHQIYLDEYDPELSDDIEPTVLDRGGYRGGRGWGYYYLNLTRALISLYRGDTPDITVLALSGPQGPVEQTTPLLQLSWSSIGRAARGYRLDLDGTTVASHFEGPRYMLDLTHVSRGSHRLTLTAIGTHTYFNLTSTGLAARSQKPLPVTSEIDFSYSPMVSESQK